MRIYLDRDWRGNFESIPWPLSPERILAATEANTGSIGEPTANALGVSVGGLRKLIEDMGLDLKVNALRKPFRRSPARFRPDMDRSTPRKLYELRLPLHFR